METDDNFVSIGTALDPIEEDDAPKKKPIPVADQIVTDEKGRRRFHGAFTGGFSAGYFNTVGTKEGWTPSTFKSTRKDRSNVKNQNVQDFMDEEDLGAFGIAPQMLRTTSEFEQETQKRGSRGRAAEQPEGPIPGVPVLDQLIQPVKDTVGVRILLRLGWRHGKGLGPLRSRKSKRGHNDNMNMPTSSTTAAEKMYSCSREDQDTGSDSASSDENVDPRLILPDDSQNILCNPKENLFGLGYSGLDRNTLSFGDNNLLGPQMRFRVNNKNLSIRGEAFGIGAFEDEDEEVYSREDVSNYDFALETPDERKNRKLQERGSRSVKKGSDERDGCIAGFVRAKSKSSSQRYKFYPAPTIPKDFLSKHSVRQSRFQKTEVTSTAEESKKIGLDRHKLTADERKILLNDAADRIHQKEAEMETSKEQDTEEGRRKLAAQRAERLLKFTAILEQNRPKSSDTAFKPFVNNPEKQERYEKYTTLVAAGFQECLKDLQPLEMTEWEREREILEFQRASSLYKPLAGVISSRFVSAKSHDISNQALSKEEQKEKLATEDPHTAAKMNLFGKLTHEVLQWHPDRLLCKRFNVPHPYPESKIIGIPGGLNSSAELAMIDSSVLSTESEPQTSTNDNAVELSAPKKKSLFENIDFSKPPPGLLPSAPNSETDQEPSVAPLSTDHENKEAQDLTVREKPSKDLFKEIFADTSSESESEEDEKEIEDRSRKIPSASEISKEQEKVVDNVNDDDDDDAYGPQLPVSLAKGASVSRPIKYVPISSRQISSKNEENLWVEKDALSRKSKVKEHKKKKSKSKSKSKHKEKHHKSDKSSKDRSRSKKKKRKSSSHRRSENTSDSDSDSDDEDTKIHVSEKTMQLLSTLKTLVNEK